MLEEATLSVSSLSPASLSKTVGSVVGRELLVCSLASRARPLGAGGEAAAPWNGAAAPGLAWQRCGGGGSCAAGSGWHRPGLAGAGAAAQPSVGSVALSLSVAVRPGQAGPGGPVGRGPAAGAGSNCRIRAANCCCCFC